ncbi:hypothetical protein [Sphingobacterium multivorum]|uniref:hypothetical protein n=1 Tax=Sphingobacterium multivorum TaxID=28454 RepID=UPI000ECC1566|nr:hypothetical protein [Sphingobacterium multivorum]HCX57184.1 hypothetical protein [Sphingobacterium sp.]
MNKDTLVRSFLKAERIKMKKARNVIIGIFLVMFAFCYDFFLFAFFSKWSASEDKLSFFYKSLPTISVLFIYLGFAFGILCWMAYIKNQKFINALQRLNDHDIAVYQEYNRRLMHFFAVAAPYLFCENEILFFPLIGNKRIAIHQIHRIETKIIRNYRGPNSYRIYFYNEFKKIHQVTMNQKGAFEFLQEELWKKKPDLVILARNH